MEEEKRVDGFFQKIFIELKYLLPLQYFQLKCQSGHLDLMLKEYLILNNGQKCLVEDILPQWSNQKY